MQLGLDNPLKGNYKWGGACVGANGLIYTIPSDRHEIMVINPWTEEVYPMEGHLDVEGKNLWQNGILAPHNNAIYCISCNAETVLKIEPGPDANSPGTFSLVGELPEGGDKWQGGVLGSDGCVYGIPEDSEFVMKVDPTTDQVTVIGTSGHHD